MLIDSSLLLASVVQLSTAATAPQQTTASVLKIRLADLEARLRENTTHRAQLQAYVEAAGPVANLAPSPRHQINLVDTQIRQLDITILNLQSDIRLIKAQIEQAAPVATPAPLPTPTRVATPAPPAVPTPSIVVPPRTSSPPPFVAGPDYPLMGMMFLILVPLAVAVAWRIARGGGDIVRRGEWLASEARIHRIEEAVDGIAKDMDRMSEGQRFLTDVLAEGPQAPGVPVHERVPR